MFKWLREYLEIRAEFAQSQRRPCESCDVLRMEVERLRIDNSRLLDRILEKPTPTVEPIRNDNQPVPLGKHIVQPWRVRQQMLEAEDRVRAAALRSAPTPVTTQEMETELGIAEQNREAEK